jgi:hypothetical protein
MVHDRDLLIHCITRFYALLVHAAYLDPAMILTPPPSGWSDVELPVEILRALGRSEAVIDLLRHMPYIKELPHPLCYEVDEVTVPINYLRDADPFDGATVDSCSGKTIDDDDFFLMPNHGDWPASFISLTRGREATWWIIDTDEGKYIYFCAIF